MLKIADIMTADVFTVEASAPVEEVAWALALRNIGGAPVHDRRGRLVGTVSKGELTDWLRDKRGGRAVVGDVMSARVLVVRADAPVIEAAELLTREGARQLVVVNEREEVVGIVTSMDVLEAVARVQGS
jgi:acetoin utilization protein AcuB